MDDNEYTVEVDPGVTGTGCPVMMSTQPDSTGAYATAGWEDQWEAVPTKNRWPGGSCGCGRPP